MISIKIWNCDFRYRNPLLWMPYWIPWSFCSEISLSCAKTDSENPEYSQTSKFALPLCVGFTWMTALDISNDSCLYAHCSSVSPNCLIEFSEYPWQNHGLIEVKLPYSLFQTRLNSVKSCCPCYAGGQIRPSQWPLQGT